MLAQNLMRTQNENSARGLIKGGNDPFRVCGNNTIDDRTKDIVHVLLVFPDLLHGFVQVIKETGIVNGDGCLITEGQQQFAVAGFKQRFRETAIDIDDTDTLTPYKQGSTH